MASFGCLVGCWGVGWLVCFLTSTSFEALHIWTYGLSMALKTEPSRPQLSDLHLAKTRGTVVVFFFLIETF